ncbi:MAG TPA: hypothetical protein VEF76_07150 [Patescibacteria group bacterium]|nr:hypothetical protein [Patescibacteria group bacterium]
MTARPLESYEVNTLEDFRDLLQFQALHAQHKGIAALFNEGAANLERLAGLAQKGSYGIKDGRPLTTSEAYSTAVTPLFQADRVALEENDADANRRWSNFIRPAYEGSRQNILAGLAAQYAAAPKPPPPPFQPPAMKLTQPISGPGTAKFTRRS